MNIMSPTQLPLLIPATPDYREAGFLTARTNEAARIWLDRTELWPERRLALWGDGAHGKTHLLRIWTGHHDAEWRDGAMLIGFPDIEAPGGIAIDNADRAEEAALLHLLNTAHDLNRPVLLAARAAPARWPVTLPDLASRLRAITAVEIEPPGDELLRGLLLRWLAQRRLVLDEALHQRLLIHLPRRAEVLRAAVARLDRDALISRRRTVSPAMLRAALAAAGDSPPTRRSDP